MRIALITAGSHGIGAAIAKDLGKDHQIVISYRGHEKEAKALAKKLPHAIAVQADLAEPQDIEMLMAAAEREFGTIEILVHCASIFPESSVSKTDLKLWHQTIDANLTSAFLTMQAVLPGMRKKKWGRIIGFVDSAIWSGRAMPDFAAYSVAKAGLLQLLRGIAKDELKNGITANAIAPSVVENATPKPPLSYMPLGRWIKLKEVAAAVRYLISEEAAPFTGEFCP